MNKRKRKIRAFTLIELLTVMAISSIVLSIGTMLYANFRDASQEHNATLKEEYKVNEFYTKVNLNVFLSDSIKDNGFKNITFYSANKHMKLSIKNDEFIFGNDTLLISNGEFETESLLKFPKKVKRLNFRFSFDEIEFNWTFKKRYGVLQQTN